jgi:hypothetical protein
VRNGDDAVRYVDDIVHGKSAVDDFKVADNATPVAEAAVADAEPLTAFQQAVEQAPDQICTIAGLISDVGGAVPGSVDPVVLDTPQLMYISFEASAAGVPNDLTTRVLSAARDMSQITLVTATDKACDVAAGL